MKGDKERLQQVLINLLSNAIRYSPPKKKVQININNQAEVFTVEIKDYGVGISSTAATVVIDSWQRIWEKLTTYFKYPAAIRKLVYTTNTIEGHHRQIRKVTKTKSSFTPDMALLKLMYLATKNIEKKWTIG